MRIDTRLAHEPFAPEQELASFSAEGAGAVASFTGLARPTTKDGAPIERLFLDHHSRLTPRSLDEIAASAERFGVERGAHRPSLRRDRAGRGDRVRGGGGARIAAPPSRRSTI